MFDDFRLQMFRISQLLIFFPPIYVSDDFLMTVFSFFFSVYIFQKNYFYLSVKTSTKKRNIKWEKTVRNEGDPKKKKKGNKIEFAKIYESLNTMKIIDIENLYRANSSYQNHFKLYVTQRTKSYVKKKKRGQ